VFFFVRILYHSYLEVIDCSIKKDTACLNSSFNKATYKGEFRQVIVTLVQESLIFAR
jgi:hypothetical protein